MNFFELAELARTRVAAPVPGAMVLWRHAPHVLLAEGYVYGHVTAERAVRRGWASDEDGRSVRGENDLVMVQRMQQADLPGPSIRTREITSVPEAVFAELRALSLEPRPPRHAIDPVTWGFTRGGTSVEWKVRGPDGFQRAWDTLESLPPGTATTKLGN